MMQAMLDNKLLEDLKTRLKRAEGQIRGIYRMVEEDKDCDQILQQIAAARAALYKVGIMYATTHLEQCLTSRDTGSTNQDQEIQAFAQTLMRFG